MRRERNVARRHCARGRRPDQAEIKAVTAGKLLDYPREKLEILVARGKQPSVQRNTACAPPAAN